MSDTTPAPAATSNNAPQLTGELPTSGVEEFLDKHGKMTAALVVLAVVVAGIYFFLKSKSEASRVEQGEAFVSAVTRSDLEAVAKKYSGTVAGGNALLMLADRQLNADMTKEAHATLNEFVGGHSGDPLYYNGLFALACVEEKLGNTDAALAGFEAVAAAGSDVVPGAAAALRAADVLLAKGELEKAKEAYEGLAIRFPGSPFILSSEERIQVAEQKITLRDNPPPPPEPEPEYIPAPGEVPRLLQRPPETTPPGTTPEGTIPPELRSEGTAPIPTPDPPGSTPPPTDPTDPAPAPAPAPAPTDPTAGDDAGTAPEPEGAATPTPSSDAAPVDATEVPEADGAE